jgi:EmrB/QacA subfamily drug resistance transporter
MTDHSSATPDTLTEGKTGLFLAVTCIAQFMVVLDVTVVNVALPAMKHALHLSITDQQWIINAYTLTFGGFLLFGGRAADLFGRKTVFLAGLGLFSMASLLGGLSQTATELIAARAVQGVGAAILAPATLSLLTSTFTGPKERARALTVWGMTASSGGAIGAMAGGVLTDLTSWRSVLYINVPIGVLLIIGGIKYLHNSRGTARGLASLDLIGTILVTGGLGTIIYAIVTTDQYAFTSAHTLVLTGIGLLAIAAFIFNESKIHQPLMPLRLFANQSLRGGNVIAFLVGATIVGFLFFLSLDLQQVGGYSPLKAGIALLPSALGTFVMAIFAGRLAVRYTPRRVIVLGGLGAGIGIVLLSHLGAQSSYWIWVLGPSTLTGAGMGCCFVPMTMAGTAGVAPDDAGIASGLINTSRQLGSALSLAVLAVIASDRTTSLLHHHAVTANSALASGFDLGLLANGLIALSMVLASALLLPRTSFAQLHAQPAIVVE